MFVNILSDGIVLYIENLVLRVTGSCTHYFYGKLYIIKYFD